MTGDCNCLSRLKLKVNFKLENVYSRHLSYYLLVMTITISLRQKNEIKTLLHAKSRLIAPTSFNPEVLLKTAGNLR